MDENLAIVARGHGQELIRFWERAVFNFFLQIFLKNAFLTKLHVSVNNELEFIYKWYYDIV